MARGNRRENIFEDDEDRRFFLQVIAEAWGRTGWRVHAWVLMSNHYHLLIETPEANLVKGMKWVQNTYTRRFNVRHRARGRVFGDRYKAVVVEGDAPDYCRRVIEDIHPVWWEATHWCRSEGRRAKWLAAADGLRRLSDEDCVEGRRQMVEDLDQRARDEGEAGEVEPLPENFDARMSHLRRRWDWGSERFAEKLRCLLAAKMRTAQSRAYQGSPERRAHDLENAEELISRELRGSGIGGTKSRGRARR